MNAYCGQFPTPVNLWLLKFVKGEVWLLLDTFWPSHCMLIPCHPTQHLLQKIFKYMLNTVQCGSYQGEVNP